MFIFHYIDTLGYCTVHFLALGGPAVTQLVVESFPIVVILLAHAEQLLGSLFPRHLQRRLNFFLAGLASRFQQIQCRLHHAESLPFQQLAARVELLHHCLECYRLGIGHLCGRRNMNRVSRSFASRSLRRRNFLAFTTIIFFHHDGQGLQDIHDILLISVIVSCLNNFSETLPRAKAMNRRLH